MVGFSDGVRIKMLEICGSAYGTIFFLNKYRWYTIFCYLAHFHRPDDTSFNITVQTRFSSCFPVLRNWDALHKVLHRLSDECEQDL